MEAAEAQALLDVAGMQTVHPPPPLDHQKFADAFVVVVSSGIDQSWNSRPQVAL
jgi:hypothetical protein